jgi:hypothetical protein
VLQGEAVDRYIGIYHHKHGIDLYPITHNSEKKFKKFLREEYDGDVNFDDPDDMFEYVDIHGPFKWPCDTDE